MSSADVCILPQPRECVRKENEFELRYDQYLVLGAGTAGLSLESLQQDMQKYLGFALPPREQPPG